MKQRKDVHGILNLLMGIAIAFFSALHYGRLPGSLTVVLLVISTLLIGRELWMMGGGMKWSTEGK